MKILVLSFLYKKPQSLFVWFLSEDCRCLLSHSAPSCDKKQSGDVRLYTNAFGKLSCTKAC